MNNFYNFELTKLSATGNDFIFICDLDQSFDSQIKNDFSSRAEFAKWVCNRKFQLGADGLVIVEKPVESVNNLRWDFYNSDGSSAEMCGNAARCMGAYSQYKNLTAKKFNFESKAGVIGVSVLDNGLVEVEMSTPSEISKDKSLILDQSYKYDFINTGVPHAVLERDNLNQTDDFFKFAHSIRFHKDFLPAGANASFFTTTGKNKINAVSFERGVDGFTFACGTGAVACAISANKENQKCKIEVSVPGGELTVDLTDSKPKLIGPALIIANVKLNKKL